MQKPNILIPSTKRPSK